MTFPTVFRPKNKIFRFFRGFGILLGGKILQSNTESLWGDYGSWGCFSENIFCVRCEQCSVKVLQIPALHTCFDLTHAQLSAEEKTEKSPLCLYFPSQTTISKHTCFREKERDCCCDDGSIWIWKFAFSFCIQHKCLLWKDASFAWRF